MMRSPVLILGGGRSGIAMRNLLEYGGTPYVWIADTRLVNDPDALIGRVGDVLVSPGIPAADPVVRAAIGHGRRIVSELAYAASLLPTSVIAVTGTNGKTTVTHLLAAICRASGADTYCAGNCGVPLGSVVGQAGPRSRVVCEVSSFMLEWADDFAPHVAVVTNLTPDHLDRHGGLEGYLACKCAIYRNMTERDVLVVNADDPLSVARMRPDRARVWTYSAHGDAMCRLDENEIVLDGMRLLSVEELLVRGAHNVANVMASALGAYASGIAPQTIARAARAFRGVAHRLEFVGTDRRGVGFYNDSKSTNIASTRVALAAFRDEVVLIAGGSPKGYEFDALFDGLDPKRVRIVATGATSGSILRAAERQGFSAIGREADFRAAVLRAAELAPAHADVLLSPACASFDAFRDYRERGEVFCKIVREEILGESASESGR